MSAMCAHTVCTVTTSILLPTAPAAVVNPTASGGSGANAGVSAVSAAVASGGQVLIPSVVSSQ